MVAMTPREGNERGEKIEVFTLWYALCGITMSRFYYGNMI